MILSRLLLVPELIPVNPLQTDLHDHQSALQYDGKQRKTNVPTWRTSKQSQRGNHSIGGNDRIVRNFRAILDYRKFALVHTFVRMKLRREH